MNMPSINNAALAKVKLRASMKNQKFTNWQPLEGAFLAGEFIFIDSFQKFGKTQFVMKIRDNKNRFWNVFLNDWLIKELEKSFPTFGDCVAITVKKTVTPKVGHPYKVYTLDVEKV